MCSSVPGGYVPCADPESPHVKAVAEFAIADYNQQGHHLTLVSILKCESEVVAGINWRLVIKAKDENNCEGNYETVVWEKLGGEPWELISFIRLFT